MALGVHHGGGRGSFMTLGVERVAMGSGLVGSPKPTTVSPGFEFQGCGNDSDLAGYRRRPLHSLY